MREKERQREGERKRYGRSGRGRERKGEKKEMMILRGIDGDRER